jgi:hypothetical protein
VIVLPSWMSKRMRLLLGAKLVKWYAPERHLVAQFDSVDMGDNVGVNEIDDFN